MIRAVMLAIAVLLSPTALLAQEKNESRREAHPISVAGGIGLLA